MNKFLLNGLAAAALVTGFAGAANAGVVTVGGVTWDTDSGLDVEIKSLDLRETAIANVGDTLTGYGLIGLLNGTTSTSFCSGCELTVVFDNFQVKNITGNQIIFSGGTVSFYVDSSPDYSVADNTSAADGTLWLQLSGHETTYTGFSDTGTLFSTIVGTPSAPLLGSQGNALFDVSGGLAASYFDTNGENDGSDFVFSSSFNITGDIPGYPISGTGQLNGDSSIPVPEPATIGLMGIGLVGLGFMSRRRRKA
jgi:hypothetical protein